MIFKLWAICWVTNSVRLRLLPLCNYSKTLPRWAYFSITILLLFICASLRYANDSWYGDLFQGGLLYRSEQNNEIISSIASIAWSPSVLLFYLPSPITSPFKFIPKINPLHQSISIIFLSYINLYALHFLVPAAHFFIDSWYVPMFTQS